MFSIGIGLFGTQTTFYCIVRGFKNALILFFTPLLFPYPAIFDRVATVIAFKGKFPKLMEGLF